ncbi:MAG: class I SAM-dependent methyltransferase [Candidatus Nealsonbacteria bacterium]
MEIRKQKEIEYYDNQHDKGDGDFEGFDPIILKSHRFLRDFLKDKCQNKRILDYGCGNGIHSVWLAMYGGEVIGIDLSKKSLDVAKQRIKKYGLENIIELILMDCEKMNFPDNYFDIIFDGGTFSSIDLNKALPELQRVLKPDGFLIGIETFGHNPITNLKRRFNKLTGRRTEWAVEHILKTKDVKEIQKYFQKIDLYFFHFTSWIVFPFLKLPAGKIILKIFEKIDSFLLFVFPFFKKYSFKVVFYAKKNI